MSHGILSGSAIEEQVQQGGIIIDPFDRSRVNPVSYDLTLGNEVKVYEAVNYIEEFPSQYRNDSIPSRFLDGSNIYRSNGPHGHKNLLDAKKPNTTRSFTIGPEGWILKPGVGYLMHTFERIHTTKFVPVLDGKSSIGRLFVTVHVTAGYGDPYFNGQYTLEVVAVHPIRVYAGMRIAQIRFHTICGDIVQYKGNYLGEDAKGAVASKSWNQFNQD